MKCCEKCEALIRDLERGKYVHILYPPKGKAVLVYHPGVFDLLPMENPPPLHELAPVNFRDPDAYPNSYPGQDGEG
jgi:hypothetical protein